jgi:hypothetical protein
MGVVEMTPKETAEAIQKVAELASDRLGQVSVEFTTSDYREDLCNLTEIEALAKAYLELDECRCALVFDEDLYHYPRVCRDCGEGYWSLHCEHDAVQGKAHACQQLWA